MISTFPPGEPLTRYSLFFNGEPFWLNEIPTSREG
jgi:hypothetical protein